jgi:hypothetical protein
MIKKIYMIKENTNKVTKLQQIKKIEETNAPNSAKKERENPPLQASLCILFLLLHGE